MKLTFTFLKMLTMDAKSESGNFFFRLQNSRMKRKRAEDNATVERRAKKVQVTYMQQGLPIKRNCHLRIWQNYLVCSNHNIHFAWDTLCQCVSSCLGLMISVVT
jgi:hypothetical protein